MARHKVYLTVFKMQRKLIYILLFACVLACSKDSDNPYADVISTKPTPVTPPSVELNPTNFAGLHQNIFSPTCANSGCHDGTFEPDFRTIESAYNTLLNHAPIKNTTDNRFKWRVKPGDAVNSVLFHRLTVDIDGQSGIMPIVVDEDSDYNAKRGQYIQNVKDWINAGAPNMFGELPNVDDPFPKCTGFLASDLSSATIYNKPGGKGSSIIPSNIGDCYLWFAFEDNAVAPENLTIEGIKLSINPFEFDTASFKTLELAPTPIKFAGFNQDTVTYTHRLQVSLSPFPIGASFYTRAYVQDNVNPQTAIPNNSSPYYLIEYFSFRRE